MIAFKLNKRDLNFLVKIFVLANFICLCFFLINIQSDKEIRKYQNNLDLKEKVINLKISKDIIRNKKIKKELEFSRSFLKEKRYSDKVEVELLIDTLAPHSLHSIYLNNVENVKEILVDNQVVQFKRDNNKIYLKKRIYRHKSFNQKNLNPIKLKIIGKELKVEDVGLYNDFTDKKIKVQRFKSSIRNNNETITWKNKTFNEGKYQFDKNIFVPENVKIKIIGNVTFQMSEKVSIESKSLFDISEGKLTIVPINKRWGSLSFHGVKGDLSNITLKSGRGGFTDNGFYDCALCFYGSIVNLNKIHIEGSAVEDSLYAIKSKVILSNSKIINGNSDGFDCDFCQLEVISSTFINNQGDGLDLSGTKFKVLNSKFINNGDKGFSVGEESSGDLEKSLLEKNKIALAVKDGSFTRVNDNIYRKNLYKIEQYIKKSIYKEPIVVYE